jgi:hypothetical protein
MHAGAEAVAWLRAGHLCSPDAHLAASRWCVWQAGRAAAPALRCPKCSAVAFPRRWLHARQSRPLRASGSPRSPGLACLPWQQQPATS